ncbi:MAG TPA: hypothetical protein PKI11_07310 [Candidatus Hydrogenedentes bacterium]|nr:hypothetical protein [Candidatus Hydrogenedentota bacterium]
MLMRRLCLVGAAVFLMVGVIAAGDAAAQGNILAALQEAEGDVAPYRNALYLYLRVAGVVWIAVEWVAAIILWHAYRFLRAAQRTGP